MKRGGNNMTGKKNDQKDWSSTIGFLFYSGALLIWSIYDFIAADQIGWQMPILFIGLALFLWLKVYKHQKSVKASLAARQ